ncbi:MAG: 3-phosphoserine/phosphohydroxythreonine transaminase [Polyangiaceae bacterium]
MPRAINFNAGPATLPLPALERAQAELLDFAGTGMSVMELSHRSKDYEAVHEEAIALLRELTGVSDDHAVLFLQGGASQHFAQIPMNFVQQGGSADVVVTGAWGEKAMSEGVAGAKLVGGTLREAFTTAKKEGKHVAYTRAPRADEIKIDPKAGYVHFTSNETIHGVQYQEIPDTGNVPLVCDMSSDFMWKKMDLSRFSMVYAGAQKNLGPSGVVIALVRKDFLERGRKEIPKIFQYRTAAENNSLYNTPPTFAIYLVRNVLSWLKSTGGLARVEADNRKKAEMIYSVIDEHAEMFRCPVEVGSRSVMNIVFMLPSQELEDKFLKEAKAEHMVGLKGHRSLGGVRVSLYNAVSVEWTKTLAELMNAFASRNW